MRPHFPLPFWQIIVFGYTTFGRAFAYLGVNPLFIGEVFIGYSVIKNPNAWMRKWIQGVCELRLIHTSVMLLILWGLACVLRSIAHPIPGVSTIDVLKSSVFSFYPICLPIGLAIGAQLTSAQFVQFMKRFAVWWAIYGVMYVGVMASGQWVPLPWKQEVPLFWQPPIAPLMPAALLAIWPLLNGWKWRLPLFLMSMVPVVVSPGRGVILGLVAALFVVSMVSARRALVVVGSAFAVLVLWWIVGPYFQAFEGRGQAMHPVFPISRIVATFNEDWAADMLIEAGYPGAADDARIASDTADWRKTLWEGAMGSLDTTARMVFGHGHGPSFQQFTPDGLDVRTPHNFAVYAIFYTGVFGLALFCLLLCGIILSSWMLPDRNIRTMQFAHIAATVVLALVSNVFEAPFGAIPFYLLSGIILSLRYAPMTVGTVWVTYPAAVPAPVAPRRGPATVT